MLEFKQKLDIKSKYYLQVLEIIRSTNHKARLVGGVVRDAILGKKSYDIDIATSMLPEEVIKTFGDLKYKVIPTGIKFGTVTVLFKNESFEITTLRKDLICDGRHAKVEYTDDFYLDALRRDFTINALNYCPFDEKIYDYFHGIKDLKAGIVKFIGDPVLRIQEDHLRILRFFRFFGRFGKELDQTSFRACLKYKSLLKNLSKERINSEIDLILALPNYPMILILLKEILPNILPVSDFIIDKFIMVDKLAQDFGVTLSKEIKYSMFLAHDLSFNNLISLKFSRVESHFIFELLSLIKQQNIDEYFLKKIWLEHINFIEYFIFLAVMVGEIETIKKLCLELKTLLKPIFPINGQDLINRGLIGREIGDKLFKLKQKWIESNFQLTKEELIKQIKL